MADAPAIETVALSKTYPGGVRALSGLDLRVEHGEVFGFLGPNGAGKSTTIRLLLDLIRPTEGRALVLGLDSRRDGVAARRRIGYLRATCACTTGSGRRAARIPRPAAGIGRPGAARRARRALRCRARPADPRALEGQPPEARARAGVHAPPRPARPRRADGRARSAAAARVPPARARDRGDRRAPSSSPPTPSTRCSRPRTASGSSAAAGSPTSTRSTRCASGRCAT